MELVDLLLQGLLLLLGWGMAVEEDDEREEGTRMEGAAEVLVEELKVSAGDGACSVAHKESEESTTEKKNHEAQR